MAGLYSQKPNQNEGDSCYLGVRRRRMHGPCSRHSSCYSLQSLASGMRKSWHAGAAQCLDGRGPGELGSMLSGWSDK